jgi:threonyl-tRNA synthetase
MLDHQDHRQIAQRLDLLHFQEEAPGMAFWHPNGFVIFRALEDAVRAVLSRDHYLEVRSPQVIRRAIWALSGHWSHFASGMFLISNDSDDGDVVLSPEKQASNCCDGPQQQPNAREAALKPVSCPGHVQIFKRASPSYRDLPMRLAELGVVHRNEASGTLQGLFRLRQFTQDDGHIFLRACTGKSGDCAILQISDRILSCVRIFQCPRRPLHTASAARRRRRSLGPI